MNWTDFSVCTDSVKVSCRAIIYLTQLMGVCLMTKPTDSRKQASADVKLRWMCVRDIGTLRDKCNEKRLIALYVHHASLAVHECSSYFLFYFHHAYLTQKMKTSFGVLYRAMSSFAYSPPVMMMCVVSGRSVTFNQYGNVAFYSGALNHSCTSTAGNLQITI